VVFKKEIQAGLQESGKAADAPGDGPDALALYRFDHVQDRRVVDRAVVRNPLDLTIPRTIQNRTKPFLSIPEGFRWSSRYIDHFIMNTMILIPLGFFATAAWRNSRIRVTPAVLLGMLFCTVFIFSMESLQYLSLTRDSSLFDASANVLGAFLGACLYLLFKYHLNHYRKALWKKLD